MATTLPPPPSFARPPKRAPVPLLLESFPVPPSHIPSSAAPNPPPTGPPGVPLPPVPGPSRISEHEQYLLLSTAANRSRRSSKYSVASSSYRESIVSVGSTGYGRDGSSSARTSIASSGKSPAFTTSPLPVIVTSPNRDSVASSRSPRSISRSPAALGPPISLSGSASGRQTPGEQLTRMSISPMPLSDIEDDDGDVPPPTMPSPTLRASLRRSRGPNDSISSIDVRDFLGVDFDRADDTADIDILPPFLSRSQTSNRLSRTTHSHQQSLADPIDPFTLLTQSEALPAPPPLPSSLQTMHYSSSNIGSYSYPSSSKLSPINSTYSIPESTPPTSPSPITQQTPSAHKHVRPPHSRSMSGASQYATSSRMYANSNFIPPLPTSYSTSSSSVDTSLPSSLSTMTQLSSSTSVNTISDSSPGVVTSPTIKDLRMEMRAERTKSAGLKRELNVRSRSRNRAAERNELPPGSALPPLPGSAPVGLGLGQEEKLGVIVVRKTTTLMVQEEAEAERIRGRGKDMTMDELLGEKKVERDSQTKSTLYSKPRSMRLPPTKASRKSSNTEEADDPRAPSPDIATILSTTKISTSRASSRSRVRSQGIVRTSLNSSRASSAGGASAKRHVSESGGVGRRTSGGSSWQSQGSSSEIAYLAKHGSWNTNSRYEGDEFEGEYDEEMERVLEGQGSEEEFESEGVAARGRRRARRNTDDGDSDSSLDLHTPLPHLMVRHGLLSPNSKLLPGGGSRAGTPLDGRPGSIMSIVSQTSVMTKSGVIKDERDTPTRRVRHRDGKLLRGGIGLTTGLGWSDSEDEDAPSPLTRRLSILNLARRSSASSIMTTATSASRRQHPLSRSYSSGALLESKPEHREFDPYDEYDDDYQEEDNVLKESGEWAQRQRRPSGGKPSRSSLPPTSWQRKAATTTSRSSVGTRTSTSSAGSAFSVEVSSVPDTSDQARTPSRIRKPSASARDSGGSSLDHHHRRPLAKKRPSGDDVNTPSSTASTLSTHMPTTPKDVDPVSPSITTANTFSKRAAFGKEKSLPPLPSGLKKTPSNPNSRNESSGLPTAGKYAFPRARTFSSTSSASIPSPPTVGGGNTSAASSVVRPLQLPRHTARAVSDRPAVPVPPVLLSSSTSHSSLRTPAVSYSPRLPPTSPFERVPSSPAAAATMTTTTGTGLPKPRTGTGMVYRTTSSVGSRMRPPRALSSSTSALAGNAVSSGAAVGSSIGRASGISRAIAL